MWEDDEAVLRVDVQLQDSLIKAHALMLGGEGGWGNKLNGVRQPCNLNIPEWDVGETSCVTRWYILVVVMLDGSCIAILNSPTTGHTW